MTLSVDRDSQEETFLFDFLYVDRPRMASYIAQLFDDGLHTSTKKTSSIGNQSSGKFSGSIPAFAKGELGATDITNEGIERQFDAAWSAPLNLIRELQQAGFIQTDIASAALGQIVLFRGNIQVLDYRLLQRLWEPMLAHQLLLQPAHTAAQQKEKKAAAEGQKHLVKVVENLPHLVQIRAFNDAHQLWGTLEPELMVTGASDLAFKYGPCIPGEWLVLAVLDAKPFSDSDLKLPNGLGEVEAGMLQMAIQLKMLFGRGSLDFGMTPLAIYRRVMPSGVDN